ncbi:MAG: TetR/AcrR family transcriptional regulator [Anaerolineales bacterium]|nr:TetR/AcrR family transcriptional regulator [Anaerolineales bacterium]
MENQAKNVPIKQDRRAVRSKRLIMGALRELVLEKDYKDISVSDIVERADIGRATFYAHFEDKDHLGRFLFSQLLMQIEKEIQAILNENSTENNTYQTLVPSLALFRIAEEKYRWFKLNATNPEIGLGMLIQPLVKRLEVQLKMLELSNSNDEIPIRITTTYLISGLVALLTDWVMEDMPESPEKMDAVFQSLAEPTLRRLTGT